VTAWEDTIARPLHALRLDRIRNQILAFAAVATLIPTLVTTIVSYTHNRQLLTDKIAEGLRSASSEAARQLDGWLAERLSDLRVSAGSYIASENPSKIRPGSNGGQAVTRLREYLSSVRQRLSGYDALLIADAAGRVVVTSSGRTGRVQLPVSRFDALRTGDVLVGEPYWDGALGKPAIVLAVPIRQADGRFLGALAAKLDLRSIGDILQRSSPGEPSDVYLMTEDGKLVIKARVSSAELMRTSLPDATTRLLFDGEGTTVAYKRADGEVVLATLRRVPQLRWAVVAETPQGEAFRPLVHLRNVTALILVTLLAGVGVVAYFLGLFMVRPLERLAGAASKVAAGDLTVELPVGGTGEVGNVTRVFRDVVTRLRERESRGELEQLSVTDGLTGLYNRRHLTGTLANEVQRSRRLRRTFSVVLADVDHFKQYNDTHGHLGGDAALTKIAEILRQTTRGVDCVARYGGEEFLVMLIETTIATAAIVAERIRARVAAEPFSGGTITVSLGVAEFPAHGDTPEALIASADEAMYRAKGEGRNRVVVAGAAPEQEKEVDRAKKRRRKGEA